MPTYDYLCKHCGYKFEVFQKMTDEPVKSCPECGNEVKRLIGMGAGPIFKGSGFYQTDYKNNKSSSPAGSSSTKSTPAATPEVKPEPKPDTQPKV